MRPLVTPPRHVYRPQEDSRLLISAMTASRLVPGRRVADLCTGSGILAVEAARLGAASVTAFDLSRDAVRCARAYASDVGAAVDVRRASFTAAARYGPFDVVVCNPPYVPCPEDPAVAPVPPSVGPALAYDAGPDGRLVLGPLCAAAPDLLGGEGTMLLVQSELCGVDASLHSLRAAGLKASVIARQWIPFGPVLTARAPWLESTGRLPRGRRVEQLIVIRVDVP
jgi:release factor glutamine methyltransferase